MQNRIARTLIGVGPLLVLVALAAPHFSHSLWRGAAWAGLMLLSYDGYGRLVELGLRRTNRPTPNDFALRLAWGMAATMLIAGVACAMHISNRPFMLGQMIAGWALSALGRILVPPPLPTRRWVRLILASPIPYVLIGLGLAACAVDYFGSIGVLWSNRNDDDSLYFYLPQKILDTGSLYDPFNVRRFTSYGGMFFMHAQYLIVGRHHQLNVVDMGIGGFLVFTHITSETSRRGVRLASPLAIMLGFGLLFSLTPVRANIGSLLTCLAAVLGTHRTWIWMRRSGSLGWPAFAILAACTASAFVLRTSCAIPVGMFLGISIVLHAFPTPLRWSFITKAHVRTAGMRLLMLAACGLASLIAWMILFDQSAGTLVYPLSRGNMTPGFQLLTVEPGIAYNVKHILADLAHPYPISTSLLLLFAGWLPIRAWRTDAKAGAALPSMQSDTPLIASVTLFGMVLLSVMGGGFDATVNSRYYFAFLVWAALVVVLGAAESRKIRVGPRLLIAGIAVLVHVASVRDGFQKNWIAMIDTMAYTVDEPNPKKAEEDAAFRAYREAQALVPKGERFAATVAEPYRFNMRRNNVMSLDLIGGLGPKPGFPAYGGPDKLADYLIANGVNYLITSPFTPKNGELFQLEHWKKLRTWKNSYLTYEAPFMFDGMQCIEVLRETRKTLLKTDLLQVIDLRARIEPAPAAAPPPQPAEEPAH